MGDDEITGKVVNHWQCMLWSCDDEKGEKDGILLRECQNSYVWDERSSDL